MKKYDAIITILVTLTAIAFYPNAQAGNPPSQPEVTETKETVREVDTLKPPVSEEKIKPKIKTEGEKTLIEVDIEDAPLTDVVSMIARMANVSILWPPTNLHERVRAKLTRTEWKPALTQILDQHGYSLVEKGEGIYAIVPKVAAGPIMQTDVFILKYATVDTVAPVVKAMLVEGASLTIPSGQNAMVVRSTSENLTAIGEIIRKLDLPRKQVCIEAKFMELSDDAAEQLGIRWDSLEAFGAKLSVGPFVSTRALERKKSRTDSLTEWDNRNKVDTINKFYDKDGVQYEERSTTWEEVPPGSGSYAPVTVVTPTRTLVDTIDIGRNVKSDILDQFAKTITEKQAAILELDSMKVILSALKKTDGVSIISNPKMIVTSGDTNAVFYVGRKEPIIITEITRGTVESPGDKITARLDSSISTDTIRSGFVETGIKLRVIPTVKGEDLIEAKIEPKLTRKIGDKEVAGNSWPIISVKEIQTIFTLCSGQTVAIGGLTDSSQEKVKTKVPLLGDIPLIGKYLFSHRRESLSRTETIIFVSLSIADPKHIVREEGIPEDAELVHKTLLQKESERRQFENEIEQLKRLNTSEKEKELKRIKRLLNTTP